MTTEQAIRYFEEFKSEIPELIHDQHARYDDTKDFDMEMQEQSEATDLALSALRAQQWISVKDGLPKEDGFYNVYMNGDIWGKPEEWAVTSCGFYDGKWDDDATISHWMPLPEPPEENEQ